MTKNILLGFFIILSITLAVFLINQNQKPSVVDNDSDLTYENVKEDIEEKEVDTTPTSTVKNSNTLDLSNQNLDKLPSYVLSSTNIEGLDISNNNLTGALPGEIRHLSNLKVLNASNNKMTGVPAEVGQLSKLEVLDLSNNQLTGLPNELGNLKKLKVLNLSGNNYSKQDLDVIRKGLSEDVEIIL